MRGTLFNFERIPLASVEPWGKSSTPPAPNLHRFDLTDGRYWIEAGDATLFEYADAVQRPGLDHRHVDDQVVRLYEDLVDMLPHVLDSGYLSPSAGTACWSDARSGP